MSSATTQSSINARPAPLTSPSEASSKADTAISGSSSAPSNASTNMLEAVDKLKFFVATAPGSFDQTPVDPLDTAAQEERCFNRFTLPSGEHVSCVLWNGLYHITGTDIVRALNFRFLAFGRPIHQIKKFEEGIFSDLRNLKSGTDATLEDPKSDFLDLLFKHNAIRTQKKQKVFYWFSVPHDRLFLDALDRDLKREKLGMEPTTQAVSEPALSFMHDANISLYEQVFSQRTSTAIQVMACPISSPANMQKTSDPAGFLDRAQLGVDRSLDRAPTTLRTNCVIRFLGGSAIPGGNSSYKKRQKLANPPTSQPKLDRDGSVSHGDGIAPNSVTGQIIGANTNALSLNVTRRPYSRFFSSQLLISDSSTVYAKTTHTLACVQNAEQYRQRANIISNTPTYVHLSHGSPLPVYDQHIMPPYFASSESPIAFVLSPTPARAGSSTVESEPCIWPNLALVAGSSGGSKRQGAPAISKRQKFARSNRLEMNREDNVWN